MTTNSAESFDKTPDEDTFSTEDVPKPDRSNWPTRITRLSEQGEDADVLAMTPAERWEMMWPLAVEAWAMKGVDVRDSRMERHIVRIIRGGERGARDVDQQY